MLHPQQSPELAVAAPFDAASQDSIPRLARQAAVPPMAIYRLAMWLGAMLDRAHWRLMPAAPAMMEMTAARLATVACIGVAAELAIADRLRAGPRAIADIAAEAECSPDALRRVLRQLASQGIFRLAGEQVGLTRLAEPLRSDHPESMRAWARMICAPLSWQRMGDLVACVRSGTDAYNLREGVGFFDWLAQNPSQAQLFDEGMSSASELDNAAIAAAYDFSSIARLADLGGGRGGTLAAILRRHGRLKGTLVDRADVLARAKQTSRLNDPAIGDRVRYQEGDLFAFLPSGHDAYFMKSVLHDWNDAAAMRILTTCHRVMHAGDRLLLAEMVLTADDRPQPAKVLDVAILVLTGGQERNASEWRALLLRAGFVVKRIIPTASPTSIIEARAH